MGLFVLGALAAGASAVVLRWRRRRGRRTDARTIGELLALSPGQFEEAVAGVLRRVGYREVRRVGGSGDLGADLVGRDPQGRRVVVQCKRYAPGARVGSPAIRPLYGTMELYRADRAIFVTTSGFTAPAVGLAKRLGIDLIDGPSLSRLMRRTGT